MPDPPPNSSANRFTVITAHFGESFWLEQLIERLGKFSNSLIDEIIVINQNRDKNRGISVDSTIPLRVVEFEPNVEMFNILGHDHPSVLQRAITDLDIASETIIVMDTDCFPIDGRWTKMLQAPPRVALAGEPNRNFLTHPCFMVIPVEHLRVVDFEAGVITNGFDTGRLIGYQLASNGIEIEIVRATRAPWGRGYFYADWGLYHYGSGSFSYSADPRHSSAVDPAEKIYLRKIEKGLFSLTFLEKLTVRWFRMFAHLQNGTFKQRLAEKIIGRP